MILKVEPVFQERIWGGRKLSTLFNYKIPDGNIGECWGISAHPNGMSYVLAGEYKGMSLAELWKNHRYLFGEYKNEEFPLLIKLLDAREDLSVQVHPNDDQAQRLEGEPYGKTECWYVVDAEPDAELILGHRAKTKSEFLERIEHGQWDDLLCRMPVKKGDFIYVPSGTIHAIGKGIVILETQQSSDTTYRVYDFDRVDATGNLRELHLEKALAVTNFPNEQVVIVPETIKVPEGTITTLVETNEFNVYHMNVQTGFNLSSLNRFRLISILKGNGQIDGVDVQQGDHLIVTAHHQSLSVVGTMEWITSDCIL
ncbi:MULTISPECIES: mannose-6-phosphate isomerase, class I [unclassified Exiguobacterium]|uniref:mannose-6-phosphate isomerase, class I n=1 Tax=unclassified Exiguobacterium TaxID=2644629 RepID=UPI001BE657B6|nr:MULTISPECIES: mannose-6-phosphate isomerase, class I [unclassified Exiguobacterium]